MRWKALAEIYKMHSFAPFSKLTNLFKNRRKIYQFFWPNLAKFVKMSLDFGKKIARILLTKSEEKQVEKQVRYRICRNFAGFSQLSPGEMYRVHGG